jgi:hypothetical protein
VPNQDLYKKAVKVSEEYLGPAGERFIRRQITTHLLIEPEQLKKQDLPQLAEWLHAAFAIITRDARYVSEYVEQILALDNSTAEQEVKVQHGSVR